jgi:hypothetical protein
VLPGGVAPETTRVTRWVLLRVVQGVQYGVVRGWGRAGGAGATRVGAGQQTLRRHHQSQGRSGQAVRTACGCVAFRYWFYASISTPPLGRRGWAGNVPPAGFELYLSHTIVPHRLLARGPLAVRPLGHPLEPYLPLPSAKLQRTLAWA